MGVEQPGTTAQQFGGGVQQRDRRQRQAKAVSNDITRMMVQTSATRATRRIRRDDFDMASSLPNNQIREANGPADPTQRSIQMQVRRSNEFPGNPGKL